MAAQAPRRFSPKFGKKKEILKLALPLVQTRRRNLNLRHTMVKVAVTLSAKKFGY